jgi:hypothetical protein
LTFSWRTALAPGLFAGIIFVGAYFEPTEYG